ncbi:hypothetical protein N8264_08295 [Candidatus Thioglobus sp.]|nr:hypothetical protein [Candidatus Thioglobus sp.]
MKKLIALFAASTVASTAAVAGIALSGTASVSYDDNGSGAAVANQSATTYDADISVVGTTGTTTVTIGMDVNGGGTADTNFAAITGADMATTIGPVTIAADMHDEISYTTATGGQAIESTDTGVTVSLDAPIGDATIGLDNSGNVSVSGTWSGVTLSHTIKDGSDLTTGSASIAGMDVSITNDGGTSTWSLGTTVSGVDLTLASSKAITAAFGLSGNTMTISHTAERASASAKTGTANGDGANGYGKNSVASKASFTTVAISRDLTSGAALSATYDSSNESLTLKASVAF